MGIVTKITTPGNNLTGSLNGRIILDEGRGRFVTTDGLGVERTVQDVDGIHVFDPDGNERSRIDTLGLTTIRSNGTYANRVGQAGSDGRDGIWTAKPSVDLRNEGI